MAGLRHALSIASFFVIHFLSEHEVSGAKNKEMGQGLSYANFVRDAFHHLDATIVGSSLVSKVSACNLACVDEPSCVSFNVGAKPVDNFGHLLCELLATDKYNASDQFHESPDFHYYSIHVSSLLATFFGSWFWSYKFCKRPVCRSLCYMLSPHVLQIHSFDQSCIILADPLLRESLQEWCDLHPFVRRRQLQVQMCCRLQRQKVR